MNAEQKLAKLEAAIRDDDLVVKVANEQLEGISRDRANWCSDCGRIEYAIECYQDKLIEILEGME
jgi:hypothetical protein